MTRQRTRAEHDDPARVLADLIQAAHLDLAVEDNPHGIIPGGVPLAALGRHNGYLRLARKLIARGVRVPAGR